MDFVEAAANLRAENYGIKGSKDRDEIKSILKQVNMPVFEPESAKSYVKTLNTHNVRCKEGDIIPQYDGANDGADDVKVSFCDICNLEFVGKNRVTNKKLHLINHHFKEKFENLVKELLAEGEDKYVCNLSTCDFETRRKPDIQRHMASKHEFLQVFIDDYLKGQASVDPLSEVSTSQDSACVLQPRGPAATSVSSSKAVTLTHRIPVTVAPSPSSTEIVVTRNEEAEAVASITGHDKDQEENKNRTQTSVKIIFENGCKYLVKKNCGQTIGNIITRLRAKSGLKFNSFDALMTGTNKLVDPSEDCSSLSGCEVRVVSRNESGSSADSTRPDTSEMCDMEESSSDLYVGLKRMRRGQLDDQRGTEINTELPEFLRKPGGQPPDSRVSEPFRLEQGSRAGPPGSRLSGPAGYLGKHYYFITTIL